MASWYERNKEHVLALAALRYKENPDLYKARASAYSSTDEAREKKRIRTRNARAKRSLENNALSIDNPESFNCVVCGVQFFRVHCRVTHCPLHINRGIDNRVYADFSDEQKKRKVKQKRESRLALNKAYVVSVMKQQKFPELMFSPEMIELKTQQLKLKRVIKELKDEKCKAVD